MDIYDYEQMVAQKFAAILKAPVIALSTVTTEPSYVGWRVKTIDGVHAEVWTMMFTWRLALVPAAYYSQAGVPFWCFERSGLGLALAMGNAARWDGSADWKPEGYTRAWP